MVPVWIRRFPLWIVGTLMLGCCFPRASLGKETASVVKISDSVRQFITDQCVDCHEGDSAEAGFEIASTLGSDPVPLNNPVPLNFEQWVRVHDRVEMHEMPPEEDSLVRQEDRNLFLKALANDLRKYELENPASSHSVGSRRLTNLQLERTLHDLLAIAKPLANLMPAEPRTDGFTGLAASQSMSHFLLESHLHVVDTALDAAMDRLLDPVKPFRRNYSATDLARSNPNRRCRDPEMIDDLAVVWSSGLVFYGRITSTTVKESGWYRIRFSASSLKPPSSGGVWCSIRSGQCNSGAPLMTWIGSFEATNEPDEYVFEAWLPAGHMIEIRPADSTLKRASFRGGQVGAGEGEPQNVPGVALHSMRIDAIHPGGTEREVKRRLFGQMKIKVDRGQGSVVYAGSAPMADSKQQLLSFASRAFRRPLGESDIKQYTDWLESELKTGKDPVEGLLSTYRALLCSSRFLYLSESPGSLNREEVACRLSYFLWGSMPDDQLFADAQSPDFLSPESLISQVDRMLQDRRGANFLRDLASQWLDLIDIDFTEPDRKLYPDFDIVVQNAMLAETHLFLESLLEKNAPVDQLINTNQTFLNSRLARYYGINGVLGDEMRLVTLEEGSHRGGLLTHGSILKVTANGTNTSPVLRGAWVSDRLLGVTIPPPPENVPAVEPDIRGAKTIRQQLELHLSHDECRACHAKMDPPGFALESFDAAGRWRETYRVVSKRSARKGAPVDASGVLVDGRAFKNFQEFRDQLVINPLPLAENFTEKLVVFGTGAPISFSERDELSHLLKRAEAERFGMRSILNQLVTSSLFLTH